MKYVFTFFIKTFLCIILFLILGILCKKNEVVKSFIRDEVYSNNISFSSFSNFYNKYLGGIFPIDSINDNKVISVFDEKLNYSEIKNYENGFSLSVDMNYLVPILSDGIVVFVGEKEKYGKVVIIEDLNGINVWYGNLCNVNVVLYDTVKKGDYLGEVCDQSLYLVFRDKNSFLQIDDYLS